MKQACELCSQEATLHCASDEAFLCFDCDARVHKANFLVARHLRQTLCSRCKSLTGKFISGERSSSSPKPICPCCCSTTTTTTSSDCISSTESSAAKKMGRESRRIRACSSSVSDISGEKVAAVADSKAEGIFVIWCRRLGLNGNNNNNNCNSVVVVSSAGQALELCLERPTALSLRACLAASFWFGLRMCKDKTVATWPNLRRLEAISGVPAKLIVAVEGKLARLMAVRRRRSRQDLEEGWAECNV